VPKRAKKCKKEPKGVKKGKNGPKRAEKGKNVPKRAERGQKGSFFPLGLLGLFLVPNQYENS
jgi:hypothetical protein